MLSTVGKQSTGGTVSKVSDFASVCLSLPHRFSLTFTPFLSDKRGGSRRQNGEMSKGRRGRVGAAKGRGVRHIGKPRSRFMKSKELLLQNQGVGFHKPTPWFPDLLLPLTRPVAHPRPFRRRGFPILSATHDPFLPDFHPESRTLSMRKRHHFASSRSDAVGKRGSQAVRAAISCRRRMAS